MKQRIMAVFLSLCMMIGLLPATALAADEVAMDIADGSIIITESGYAQGVLHYENGSGYSVQNSEGEPITETTWSSGSHELTITGESDNATILIMSGSPEITLKDLKIIQSNIRIPGLVLVSSSDAESPNTATLILEGDNTFSSKDQVPGVQINKNATLTIQGSGTLNASTTNHTAGIGAARVIDYSIDPETKLVDKNFRSGGNLVIESGTIHAAGHANSGSIGKSRDQSFGTIEIKGGIVSTLGSNSSLSADSVEISGGTLTDLHKPISATNLNITGGNIGDSYSGEISGRKLTKLAFFGKDGERQEETEVTITEGDHTWTALTDENGMVTTYLKDDTTLIQAQIGDGKTEEVTITDGLGVVGASCTCADKAGTLTMTTKPQSLTTVDGEATLDLEATYSPDGCVLPDGFHGEYEDIGFEVTKVVKNGQYQQISGYTSITGNTLTVYGETNQDPYTVYVRAVSGPDKEVQSSEIAINVNTFVSEVPEGELDIEEGPIVITDTGYTQGEDTYSWNEEPRAITITQTDATTPLDSYIQVESGTVDVTLKDINLTNSSRSPFQVNGNSVVTVILEGENTLTSTHTNSAALAIGSESTVNIKVPDGQSDAYGILTATGTVQAAGIGGGRAIESGTVNIQSGTIVASAGAYVSGIGPGRKHDMKAINISGGHVTVSGGRLLGQYNDGSESCADTITISGGYINANGIKGDSLTILGGNICGSYSDTISGRVLTKLYFVADEYGTPLTDTKVTVTENSDTWTAYTDENGIITTYLADATTEISATIDTQEYNNISVANHQALIGGKCFCSSFTDITWEHGLPESITLHNLQDEEEPVSMDYDVPAAQLVTDRPCNMPIHPSLPEITYELSVTKNEASVAEENLAGYASFINNHLTLLPGNAPYTVTLTAKAGDKNISHRIKVNKGETSGGETGTISTINLALGDAVINYTEDGKYTYTQGNMSGALSSGTILITGFAADGSVTVNGGSPTLVINQNNPNDVWTICETDATRINLQFSSFNGKLYFGEMEGVQSTLTQDCLTLNPEYAQNITFGNDNIVCGVYTINGVGNRKCAVYGANLSGETVIQNNSSNQIDVDVNDNMVHLSSGQSTTIPKADYIFSGNGKENNVRGYIYENGTKLVYAGEGKASGPERSMWNEEPLLTYRGTITQVVFAPDIDEIAGSVIYLLSGIDTLAIKYATTLNGLYNARMKTLLLGSQVTTYTPGNYLLNLEDIVVEEGNTAFSSDEGVLYTADHTTLLVCPTKKTGDYALLDDCEIISNTAFSGSNLTTLTLNASLKEIGNRAFESAAFQEIRVAAGNTAFKSVDGALYSGDGDRLILCPLGRTAPLIIPEGVTALEPMAVYTNSKLTSITLPSSLESVDGYFLAGVPIKEMTINSKLNQANVNYDNGYCKFFDSQVLRSLTVPDGYDFANSNLFTNTSMNWVTGINVIGGQDTPYDGAEHGVTVTVPDGATVQYSIDGEIWQSDSFAWKDYGNYTVYWQVTYNGGTVYSQTDFTIGGLEASEDWFTLSEPVTADEAGKITPVTLHKPAGAPSLENGYTVNYSKDGTGEATEIKPTEAGSYLVTVKITAEGYVQETLTLGNYVILSAADSGKHVISFVTNGGKPIKPIIAASNDDITEKVNAINPTRAGYTFAGWYSDSALRNRVESLPTTMPGEHTTYYAKWTRDAYTIKYDLDDGTVSGNPEGYTAETPTFTLKNPTKAGYEFTGWTGTDLSEPTKEVTIEKGSSGDRVYTANWEGIEYTITYPMVYDKVESNPKEYTLNTLKGITLNQPADRQGYTFIGWSMVIDNNSSYILPEDNPVIPAGTYGNLTLSGIWLADNQTMTFHANGGKFANGTETYVISGAYDSPLSLDVTNPTRSGYRFRGWFTDKECTQLFEASNIETMPLSMNIYAGWKKKSSSSSESTEGSGTSSVSDHVVITTNSGKLTDSQIEEAVKKAEKDSVITIQAVKSDEVVLRAGAMETLVENENDLLIQLRDGEVTLPVKAMKGLIEGAKSSYEIGVSLEEQTSSDDATVSELLEKGAVIFDVVITVNGKEIHSFDKGLTLAFKVPGLKDMEEPVVLHLLQDGEQESYKPDEISGDTLTIKGIKNLSVFAVLSGNEEKAETENPFADVFENDYYFNSVLWAVTNGVTAGTSDITFSPDVTVSRAQMVTFLWRAAGSPAAEGSNPFTDVSVSDYYYNAVLWAVANGVTAGTSDTTFSPDAPVSRAQAVTFQWRAAGGPAVSGESFTDIPEGAYYGPAVTWAVANGITSGTGDHQFSPDAPVSRAQAVTFLYRQYK